MATLLLKVALPGYAEAETWVFEGLISQSDPALAPALKSGWVLAGSFLLDPLELEEEFVSEDARSGRLANGITQAELTVDLYYSVKFEALQVPGMAGFDYTDDDPEREGRDLLGWFLPMRGKLAETEWSLQWLQVWLADPSGDMMRTVPPPVPPSGFEWESGWFRLTFVNSDGAEVHADGHLNVFSPAETLEAVTEEQRLSGMVAELSSRLQDRDSRIAGLQKELEEATERLNSVRRMVDLLVEERTMLLEENNRLSEQAGMADPEAQERLADLASEKALLEQDISDLKDRNQVLAESLGESEFEKRQLLRELQALREELETEDEGPQPNVPKATGTVTAPTGKQGGSITVYENPVVIEKPVPVPVQAVPAPERAAGNSGDAEKESGHRRFGPRKFR